VCCYCVRVKSILGRSPKVKESIKDLFKYVTWLGGVHVGLRVRVQDTIAA
jgi:thioredoxin-related protein